MPVYKLKPGDRDVIRQQVGAMHVSASVRAVLRPFLQRTRQAFASDGGRGEPSHALWRNRDIRRAVYREALRCHEKNRALYRRVMRGGP